MSGRKKFKQNENNNKLTVNARVAAFYSYITKTCNQMVRHCQPLNLERIASMHCVCVYVICVFLFQVRFSSIHQNVGANILAIVILHTLTLFYGVQIEDFSVANQQK